MDMRSVWGRQNMLQRHVPLSGAWRVGGLPSLLAAHLVSVCVSCFAAAFPIFFYIILGFCN